MKIVYIIILNIDIFIPIRLGSSRLPKKSLKKINGKFILLHLIDRLQNIENIRNIVVCTRQREFVDVTGFHGSRDGNRILLCD